MQPEEWKAKLGLEQLKEETLRIEKWNYGLLGLVKSLGDFSRIKMWITDKGKILSQGLIKLLVLPQSRKKTSLELSLTKNVPCCCVVRLLLKLLISDNTYMFFTEHFYTILRIHISI